MSMASNNSIHNMSEFKVSLSARYFRDCIRKDRMTSLASNLLMKNHDSFIGHFSIVLVAEDQLAIVGQ